MATVAKKPIKPHVEQALLETRDTIRELMRREGVNQRQLAERLGWSRGQLGNILRANTNCTLRTLAEIFYALNSEVVVSEK